MSFEKLLRPASVAVIGASTDPNKVGSAVLNNIIAGGYQGAIFPVNPKAENIQGLTCYPSLEAIPEKIDLAIIVVKRDQVVKIVDECGKKGTSAVIIITAGFGETGEEGKKVQREIAQIARQYKITMVGPNCLGIINPWHKLNASFGQAIDKPGGIGLISQSGAIITAVQDWAKHNKIGFSILASIGNKASIDEVEFLQTLQHDPNTKVIGAYLEDISRGQEFMRIAERVGKIKPVIILKAGKTTSGAIAASSHTGSLAGTDSAYNCAFERTGVIRADSIEHLFDVAEAFEYQPLPKGKRIAVVTNAGGPGIMTTDALELAGLTIAKIDELTQKKLSDVLPNASSIHNPVDVLGDADGDRYGNAMDILLASENIDALIVVLTPQKMTDDLATAKQVVAISHKYDKPVFACFMGADIIAKGIDYLEENGIPHYPIPERAAKAMQEMFEYSRYKKRPLRMVERFAVNKNPVVKIFKAYRSRNRFEIGESDAKTILKAYNFEIPRGTLVNTVEDAVRFADEVGFPLAMKISSPDIFHKSDIGGVTVGLNSASAVEDAFELMMLRIKRKKPDAFIRGVMIEKMITSGREVILGMKKDPQFGPMLMFGLGGIFVEVLKDVTFSLAPITAEECRQMIERTKTYSLLTGVRGEAPVDIPVIIENLQRMSQLVMDFPEIEEIDINPLKVGEEGFGASVVDARLVITKEI